MTVARPLASLTALFLLSGCAGIAIQPLDARKPMTAAEKNSPGVQTVEAKLGIAYEQIPICGEGPPVHGADGVDSCILPFSLLPDTRPIPPLTAQERAALRAKFPPQQP